MVRLHNATHITVTKANGPHPAVWPIASSLSLSANGRQGLRSSELVTTREPENLNVLLAPVDGDRYRGREWGSNSAQTIAAVDPVVQVFGSQQDVGRCHPFSAATYHLPTLGSRLRGIGYVEGRSGIKECVILDARPRATTGDVKHGVVEPAREPELGTSACQPLSVGIKRHRATGNRYTSWR